MYLDEGTALLLLSRWTNILLPVSNWPHTSIVQTKRSYFILKTGAFPHEPLSRTVHFTKGYHALCSLYFSKL